MNKFKQLISGETTLNIAEKRKTWFKIPISIFILTVILGTIFGFMFGNPLNLGIDFTGGYSITITVGHNLTTETQDYYEEEITYVFESLENEYGVPYELSISDFTLQGEGSSSGLYVLYTSGHDEGEMDDINDELKTALIAAFFADDVYVGGITSGDTVSSSVSAELLINALCAILLAIVLMLLYIAMRFELLSGIAAVICLFHDILIMLAAMIIFQVSITTTFIAALITILGYSINNTIIIFDKVRDINKHNIDHAMTPNAVANKAVQTTMVRSINTTITTLTTILMVALVSIFFGVMDMLIFCFPLIVGILAGTFSSIFLAPSIWSLVKDREYQYNIKHPKKVVEVVTITDEVVPVEVETEAEETADNNSGYEEELISQDVTE